MVNATTTLISLVIVSSWSFAACPVAPANVPSEDTKKLAIGKLSEFLACSEDRTNVLDLRPLAGIVEEALEAADERFKGVFTDGGPELKVHEGYPMCPQPTGRSPLRTVL